MLRAVVGMGQVVLGSAYPYLRRRDHEVATSAELNATKAALSLLEMP
jgi:hypothetical protein